jgi:phage terminase large subunit-like protein
MKESDFLGQPCAIGCDLASVWDLCAVVTVFSKRIENRAHHYAFCKAWLPRARQNDTPAYAQWEADGELIFTETETTDLDVVEKYILGQLDKFSVRDISFDPLQAAQMMGHLERRRKDLCVALPQNGKTFTPALNELQSCVMDGRLHTNSKLLLWALGNLRVKDVGSSLKQPMRPTDRAKKIDPAVALLMALRSVNLKPLDEVTPPPVAWVLDWDDGSITNMATGRDLPRHVESQPESVEPDRPGMTRVRMLGTGDVKWLPHSAIPYLIESGAAERC